MPGSPGTERLLELMQRVSGNMRSPSAETWPDLELTEPRLRALLRRGPVPMSVPAAERWDRHTRGDQPDRPASSQGPVSRDPDPRDRRVLLSRLTPSGQQTAATGGRAAGGGR